MAFRKSIVSFYRPLITVHRFGDFKDTVCSSSPSSKFVKRLFNDSKDLSKEALPLITLDSLLRSGETIDGSVSFAPTDLALISSRVESSLSDFISSTDSSNISDHEG